MRDLFLARVKRITVPLRERVSSSSLDGTAIMPRGACSATFPPPPKVMAASTGMHEQVSRIDHSGREYFTDIWNHELNAPVTLTVSAVPIAESAETAPWIRMSFRAVSR